jgi:hypothetical protein
VGSEPIHEDAVVILRDALLDQPLPALVVAEHIGEKVFQEQHLYSSALQGLAEAVVILLGSVDPEHVVEEEISAVGRGQASKTQIGPVQEDPAEDADLRVYAQGS